MMQRVSMGVAAGLIALLLSSAAGANPDFEKGLALLQKMEPRAALSLFQRALARPATSRKQKAQIHLHIGIAQAELLNNRAARASFERALSADPSVKLPGWTSPKIAELFKSTSPRLPAERPDFDQPAPAVPKPPAPTAPPTAPPSPPVDRPARAGSNINWPAWIALGAGVAAGATGIALGALSRSAARRAENLALPYHEAQTHHDRAKTMALSANILFGVAGAAAITSGVLFYLGWHARRAEASTAAVVPLRDGALLSLTLRR